MQKKLLAVAVAGAFTVAPLAAFAQSSVTISGFFKVSMENISINSFGGSAGTGTSATVGPGGVLVAGAAPLGGRVGGLNSSQGRLADDSSRIVFNIVEDLGGGMQAIGQADMRINMVNPSSGLPPMSGNTWVGIKSTSWGTVRMGLQDLHYGARESYLTDKGDLRADSISILAYAGGGGQSIANATRTPNVVFYDTPSWSGFTLRAAYSFSPQNNGVSGTTGALGATGIAIPPSTSADIGSNARRGQGWNFNPNYANGPLVLGYSYWNSKQDNPNGYALAPATNALAIASTASMDQRSDRLYGSYKWGGFRFGLAWDRSRLTAAQGFTGVAAVNLVNGMEMSRRNAWSVPLSYEWGPHEIHVHFDKAQNDRDAGNGLIVAGADTSATMFAASYQYNLSKRTSLALNYAQINNGAQATYNFFTSTSLGSADAAVKPGEDPRLWSLTVRHAF